MPAVRVDADPPNLVRVCMQDIGQSHVQGIFCTRIHVHTIYTCLIGWLQVGDLLFRQVHNRPVELAILRYHVILIQVFRDNNTTLFLRNRRSRLY